MSCVYIILSEYLLYGLHCVSVFFVYVFLSFYMRIRHFRLYFCVSLFLCFSISLCFCVFLYFSVFLHLLCFCVFVFLSFCVCAFYCFTVFMCLCFSLLFHFTVFLCFFFHLGICTVSSFSGSFLDSSDVAPQFSIYQSLSYLHV